MGEDPGGLYGALSYQGGAGCACAGVLYSLRESSLRGVTAPPPDRHRPPQEAIPPCSSTRGSGRQLRRGTRRHLVDERTCWSCVPRPSAALPPTCPLEHPVVLKERPIAVPRTPLAVPSDR